MRIQTLYEFLNDLLVVADRRDSGSKLVAAFILSECIKKRNATCNVLVKVSDILLLQFIHRHNMQQKGAR
jgi:hypothetical protein